VRSPEIAKESEPFIGRRTCLARSPILGTRTSEVRKGGHSTSRVVKLKSDQDHPFESGQVTCSPKRESDFVDHFEVS
jgi:hypothetical protein